MATVNILLRVQSPSHGTKRIETKPSQRLDDFLHKVQDEFSLPSHGWRVFVDRGKTIEVVSSKTKTLSTHKLKHGDMLYLVITDSELTDVVMDGTMATGSTQDEGGPGSARGRNRDAIGGTLEEDDVDQFMWKQDGKIAREKNDQLCHHGPQGKCLHCMPYEPYDEEYLAKVTPPIKFLSFHSYLRKLTGGVDKGKFAMLENVSCKIKSGCKEHLPWPGGICTKCQPNAVTLQRQKYRHVDYIQFENQLLVERFLDYWRKTGDQRVGYLYGRYEHHKDVPLGIKAVVTAIYEPKQVSTKSSVELLDDPEDEAADQLAARLRLRKVGWIFTDLVPLDTSIGSVKHFRGNINSHFLSAEECIVAAGLQSKHHNPCRLSPEGHFGSKFVTVVVTGDVQNQIHFEGYQVSNQCMALVHDDCVVPTLDAPELGYIKESTNEQYVPDVFYKVKDEYGNEVTQLARPLPVEYLLVDMPAAFPMEMAFTFCAVKNAQPFAVENRQHLGETQDFNSFADYMHQFSRDGYLEALSDFHLLIYLANNDMLPLKEHMDGILEAVRVKDDTMAYHWFKLEAWATVEQLLEANVPSPQTSHPPPFAAGLLPNSSPIGRGIGANVGPTWSCRHCTFLNQHPVTTCDMCGLPKE